MSFSYSKDEIILSIQDVGLTLGGKEILRGVNANVYNISRPGVEQGQVVCFLGASGVGKTRLSRLIAGLDKPNVGKITLGGEGKPIQRGVVGMVPQHYGLFKYMTLGENLDVASKGPSEKKTQLIETLELGDHLGKYPKQLSGGQRQRGAIARQFLCSEHIVILDEPFSGLDLVVKERTCSLLTKIAQLHTLNTVIIVTHDVTEGMSVADTVWLMGKEDKREPARIMQEWDLAHLGLAWRDGIIHDKDFSDLVAEVKRRFREVSPR